MCDSEISFQPAQSVVKVNEHEVIVREASTCGGVPVYYPDLAGSDGRATLESDPGAEAGDKGQGCTSRFNHLRLLSSEPGRLSTKNQPHIPANRMANTVSLISDSVSHKGLLKNVSITFEVR